MIGILQFIGICTAVYMVGRQTRILIEWLIHRAVNYFLPPRD